MSGVHSWRRKAGAQEEKKEVQNKPATREEIVENSKELSAGQLTWEQEVKERQYRCLKFDLLIAIIVGVFLAQ